MSTPEIIEALHLLANPEITVARKKKFGIVSKNALGISMKELNELAKPIKKNTALALELIATDIYEAKILAAKIIKPTDITPKQMDTWVSQFDNWEYCDTYCMQVFSNSKHARQKIVAWSTHASEFVKRAAFATLAALCSADKKSDNHVFVPYFDIIVLAATDERLYVRKAVNWALRSIGKRNEDLLQQAIEVAQYIKTMPNKTANWIATDALTEFNKPNMRLSQYPRSMYRKN